MKPKVKIPEECQECVIFVKKKKCEYRQAAVKEEKGCRYKKEIKRQNGQTTPASESPEIPPESAH